MGGHMFIPRQEFDELTAKIGADCKSIRRALTVPIAELSVLALIAWFALGVEVGKCLA